MGVSFDTPDIGEQQHKTMKQMVDFPTDKAFPSLDMYRMYLLHSSSSDVFT